MHTVSSSQTDMKVINKRPRARSTSTIPVRLRTILLLYSCQAIAALSIPTEQSAASDRRSFVVSGFLGPLIASAANPENAVADAPSILYPSVSGGASLIRPPYEIGSWKADHPLTTKLAQERIQETQVSPLNQIVLPFSEQEVYYPSFLFGPWNLAATLKSKKYPFGRDVVQSNSLVEGSPRNREEQVGDSTSYEVHYFSTLANTASNQVTVYLGLGVPQSKIIADRAFNAISLSKAYKQLAPVQDVEWDYGKDPTKLTLRFGAGAVADDMRPLGQRRGEVFITGRSTEEGFDSNSGEPTFCAAERIRAVTLAPGNVIVSDSEVVTEFRKLNDDHVTAVSRIAVYLTPNPNSREGVLWQQVQGKAVALFDYEWDMTRLRESFTMADGATMERPCVRTPKDVVQCR